MSVILSGPERQYLRIEVDRKLREKIGGSYKDADEWITFGEASEALGVKASVLRERARARGLSLLRSRGGRNKVNVADLDRLR